MPRRKKKRQLTMVEMLILLAMAGIFLSIIVSTISAKKGRGISRDGRPAVVRLPGEPAPVSEERASGGLGTLLLGFGLGVAATLLYQRWFGAAHHERQAHKNRLEETAESENGSAPPTLQ